MKTIRTVLLTGVGALIALAGFLGGPPPAEGQDACVHASVDDGIVTTTVHHDTGWCPARPPVNTSIPCPGGVGTWQKGELVVEYEVLACLR